MGLEVLAEGQILTQYKFPLPCEKQYICICYHHLKDMVWKHKGKKKKVCCNKKTNSKPFKIKTKQKINAKTRNKIKKKKKRVRKSQR